MKLGCTGKILKIYLSDLKFEIEMPPESFYRKYMGGSGIGLYYLLNEMPPGKDALSEKNILTLCLSVVTGLPVSGLSRMTANAKSPLTGAIGDSQCGGFWPAKLKFSGFDGIIIKGKAKKPTYLFIDQEKVEFRDAQHLWGKKTGETQSAIINEIGDDKIEILQIGPAGEKLVRFASILNMCNRANGRTGMGAVMGSKLLKAIVVRGNMRPKVYDSNTLKNLNQLGLSEFPKSNVAGLGKYGTAGITIAQNEMGGLPSYNFSSGIFESASNIGGQIMYEKYLAGCDDKTQDKKGRDTCFGCLIRCKRVVEIKNGPFEVDPIYGGPEYETIGSFGSYCGNADFPSIAKANELCNAYGMDTISCGATIAWAMDAFEKGILNTKDTDGVEIKFGDNNTLIQLIKMIGEREGFGNTLAEGSFRASEILGKGKELLTTCKMLEAPAHMPQIKRSLALIYATNPFGADHMSSEHDFGYTKEAYDVFKDRFELLGLKSPVSNLSLGIEKIEFARITQALYSFMDSANLCQFVWGPSWQLYSPQQMVTLLKAATGWDISIEEILEVGERRLNMMKVFNQREGFDSSQDKLPIKFYENELVGGPSDKFKVDIKEFKAAVKEYYSQCGWDEKSGIPTNETLNRLNLSWINNK